MVNISPETRQQIAALAQIELARRSYYDYVEYVHRGDWKRARHIALVCSTVELLLNDELKSDKGGIANILIIGMPPQHGKSQSVTETLPSWYLGKNPTRRVIEVSYGDDLARRFGRRNKQKINEFGGNLFGIELSNESRSDTEFEIKEHKGSMISRGIMAGITGQPGDLIIIDDPIKNRQEADSEVYRERIWEEWLNSIKTRLSAAGKVILIQTRWHEEDLAGRLIKEGKEGNEKVYVLNLPCEAEENDPLGREPGEPLFPEIGKDKVWLEGFKQAYQSQEGNRAWLALFQGRPRAQDGNIFKRHYFRYFSEVNIGNAIYFQVGERKYLKHDCWCFQTVDTANSEKTINDYFVVAAWYVTPQNDLLLYDVYRTHIEGPDQKPLMKEQLYRYRPRFQAIEDKTFGTNLIQECKREGMTIRAVKVDKDKVTRSLVIAARYEVGKVYHRENAPWLTDYEDELLSFPRGKHDDQVDTASMAGEIVHSFVAETDPWSATSDGRGKPLNFDLDEESDEETQEGFW